jgi:hypothetical protein
VPPPPPLFISPPPSPLPSRATVCSGMGKLTDCGNCIAASRRHARRSVRRAASRQASWSLLESTAQSVMGSAQVATGVNSIGVGICMSRDRLASLQPSPFSSPSP